MPNYNNFYSVYERGTDRPIFIHGTPAQCAEAMGVPVETFYHYLTRIRKGLPNAPQKYEIIKDDFDEEDID